MIGSFLRKAQITSGGGCTANAEPDVVTGLTATASGQTTINLAWDADSTANPNKASEYDIERSNDGTTGWSVIATISAPATSYSDTTLSASQQRWYRLVARNCHDTANASTSANATTAAAGLSPSWSLDFSTGTPSGYTLTRASSATRVDSSGYIASSSTDVARLTHNSSGSRLGLLVEASRTNLVLQSEAFNTTWSGYNATVGANAATSPDNTTTADEIREGSTTDRWARFQGITGMSSNTVHTFSCYLKKPSSNGRDFAALTVWLDQNAGTSYGSTFDLVNGTVGTTNTNGTVNNTSNSIENVGNGWYRCSITFNTGAFTRVHVFCAASNASSPTWSQAIPQYAGTLNNCVLAWGAQVEAASTASSYIPTTTASVTRSADLAHVLDSSITNWGDPGALVIHFYAPGQAGTLISTDDASTAQVGIEASTTTAARAFWSSGSTATGTIGTGVQKAVHYWTGSTSKFCINGGTVQSGSNNLTIANTDFVTLGAEATESGGVPGTFSQYANCIIRKVEFYSGTLTDANIQTITT